MVKKIDSTGKDKQNWIGNKYPHQPSFKDVEDLEKERKQPPKKKNGKRTKKRIWQHNIPPEPTNQLRADHHEGVNYWITQK